MLDLLGGPAKDELPAIASSHATSSVIEEMAEEIAGWLATGLTGVKVGFGKLGDAHLGFDHDRDVAFMRAVRAAIGPSARIMIDCGVRDGWTVPDAVRRVRAFEEHGLDWIEEPLGADDPEGYLQLRRATATLIAYGEREFAPAGVERILRTASVDVVGLDPGRVGGITGFAQACRTSSSCTGARATRMPRRDRHRRPAASLAISWAKPVCKQLEEQPFKGPMQHDLIGGAIVHDGGRMGLPTGPGLGIAVDESVVRRFLIELAVCLAAVTGAASGIGLAVADELLRSDPELVVAALDLQPPAAGALAAHDPARIIWRSVDVADHAAVEAVAAELEATVGRPRLLACSAGIQLYGRAEELPRADFDRVLDINLGGVLMRARPSDGG